MKKELKDLRSAALSPSGLLLLLILALTGNLPKCNGDETTGTGGTGGDGGSGADGGTGGLAGSGGTGADAGSAGMAGTGGAGGTTGSGGAADCYPTNQDPTAALCADVGSCKCHDMTDTMPAGSVCPYTAGNSCTPGHAQCGCDLPLGTDYVPPDANCKKLVNGDTWTDGGQLTSTTFSEFDSNGQLKIFFGTILQPAEEYFDGFTMSGTDIEWGMSNPSLTHCDGFFAVDCKTADIDCWYGNEASPFAHYTLYYLSP